MGLELGTSLVCASPGNPKVLCEDDNVSPAVPLGGERARGRRASVILRSRFDLAILPVHVAHVVVGVSAEQCTSSRGTRLKGLTNDETGG